MASFYADEQFPLPVVEFLRLFGHDVLTVQEAGHAGQGIPDEEVLEFAINQQRALLTINKSDFIRLHRLNNDHFGIVVCTQDRNWEQFAKRIHEAVTTEGLLKSKLIRITRPAV